MARLKEQYVNEIAPALNSKFGYKSVMQIPKPVSYTHLDVYKRQVYTTVSITPRDGLAEQLKKK